MEDMHGILRLDRILEAERRYASADALAPERVTAE
jgi:hypothetical protein